jgi:hypothetical protein
MTLSNQQKLYLIKTANTPNSLKSKVNDIYTKTKAKAYKNPEELKKAIDFLMSDKLSVPALTALIGGTGYGLFGGGDEEDEEKRTPWWKRVAQGAGIGGAVGLGSTFAAPGITQGINNAIWRKGVAPLVGRVATNLIHPVGYTDDKMEMIKKYPKESLKAIWEDKYLGEYLTGEDKDRMYKGLQDETDWYGRFTPGALNIRRGLFREGFGMDPQYSEDYFKRISPKVVEFNPESPFGKNKLEALSESAALSHKAEEGESWIDTADSVLGSVYFSPTGKGTYAFKDPWDFSLAANDDGDGKLDRGKNVVRYVLDKMMSPVTVQGEFSPAELASTGWREEVDKSKLPNLYPKT